MGSSDSEFEDALAGYLTVATLIVIAVFIVIVMAVVIGVCLILWEGYSRYGRTGHPRANHLRAIGAIAIGFLLVSFAVSTETPEAGFWLAAVTMLVWVIRVWIVGKQEQTREKALLAEAMDELSSLEAYLDPFGPDAEPIPLGDLDGVEGSGPAAPSRLDGFGDRVRGLRAAVASGDSASLDGMFGYLFSSGGGDLVSQANVRKILHQ